MTESHTIAQSKTYNKAIQPQNTNTNPNTPTSLLQEDVRVRTDVARTNMLIPRLTSGLTGIGLGSAFFHYRHAAIERAHSFARRRIAAGGLRFAWQLLGGGVSVAYGPVTCLAAMYFVDLVHYLSWPMCRRYTDRRVQQLDPQHSAFRRVVSAPLY